MKLVSNATTIAEFRADVLQYIELRAEQNRAAERSVTGKNIKKMYIHAASEIQSIADDLRYMDSGNKVA
jgi:hypothetical protein